jgi:hypothetical protein
MSTETDELDRELVEEMRAALMRCHHHDWEMETVSNAAHLIAEVVAQTGRGAGVVLDQIDAAVSLFDYDSVRQRALDALRAALRSDAVAASSE